MKILFVTEKLRKGGKERRMVELIKGLSKYNENIDVHVMLFPEEMKFKELQDLKVKIYFINFTNNIRLYSEYKNVLSDIKPDIVQTWTLKTSFYFSLLKYNYQYKLIASYIADCFGYIGISNFLQGKYVNLMADKVVGNSEAGMNAYKVNPNKRIVIYNGFDTNRIKTKANEVIKQELKISSRFVVLMVANVTKYKDYSTFLSVAREVIKRRRDITFISVGGGKLLEQFKIKVKKEELENIRFLGELNEVEEIISISDIGLLCSYNEGISNSIIEYMMHQKPVIATGTGGLKELISHNQNGFLYDQGDYISISNKIEELVDDRCLTKEIGVNSYLYAIEKFSLSKSVEEYVDLYKNIK